jgi:large subunit ribosomal protein L4
METVLYNQEGKELEKISISDSIFSVKINKDVLFRNYYRYLNNKRSGCASTKTRKDVSGGGRKPWRQKGTGRARHGSIRSPIWKGGGVVFGPHPRDYKFNIPKKMRKNGIKMALTIKVQENKFQVIENFDLKEIKTKKMLEIMKNLNVGRDALIVVDEKDEILEKSLNNIRNVKLIKVLELNVFDILKYEKLIITLPALRKVEEIWGEKNQEKLS